MTAPPNGRPAAPNERDDAFARARAEEDELFANTVDPRATLTGLALSGGGIRSATFALGVLQALGEKGLLWMFDYLSTVSGGGYAGAWWTTWLARQPTDPPNVPPRLFPPDERLEPDRFPALLLDAENEPIGRPEHLPGPTPDGSRSAVQGDALHHLRLFSNYLTPRKGALSGDTWRAITVISRNILLTWIILLPLLLTAVLLGQIYFAGNEETAYWFVCSRPDSLAADTAWRLPAAGRSEPRLRDVRWTRHIRQDGSRVCRRALTADSRTLDSLVLSSARKVPVASRIAPRALGVTHAEVLRQRMQVLLDPVFAALLLLLAFTLLWMMFGNGSVLLTLLGVVVVATGMALAFGSMGSGGQPFWDGVWRRVGDLLRTEPGQASPSAWGHFMESKWFLTGSIGAILILLVGAVSFLVAGFSRDRARNVIVRWHARVLVVSVLGAITLLLAGFGHELTWFLFDPASGTVASAARAAGGWLALAVSLGSGLFTILRAGPTSEGKDAQQRKAGVATRVTIAVAPFLVLAVLVVASATFGQRVFATVTKWLDTAAAGDAISPGIHRAALVGLALVLVFGLYERWKVGAHGVEADAAIRGAPRAEADRVRSRRISRTIVIGLSLLALVGGSVAGERLSAVSRHGVLAALAAVLLLASWRLGTTMPDESWRSITTRAAASRPGAHRKLSLGVLVVATSTGLALVAWWLDTIRPWTDTPTLATGGIVGPAPVVALLVGLTFLAADVAVTRHEDDRAVGIMALAAVASGALTLVHYFPPNSGATAFATVGLGMATFLVAAVIGLGWMADPNLMALHNFYKARLVRAYLGASNTRRNSFEITESAPGDDIPVKELKHAYRRGGPVHVINTTLNLVGGRDLSTAQRYAALFTISPEVCGSARTGYHRTEDYMNGTLTVGTAVAASGAAVSTNMGSKSMSSALALLLALFNIRLGVWAPTPNKSRWREAQARLWPFYLLREALSQTNDLGTYCYLTDGGHFENTGLYSLVERGCHNILMIDSGADDQPCFSDVGEAIRRCRIDFGAEIQLTAGVEEFIKTKDGNLATVHFARGTIQYADTHLRMLGWTNPEIEQGRTGTILWIKPVVTAVDSVDVRQYKLENSVFPQQTTVDQWYDESQFESYRALGYQSIAQRLEQIGGSTPPPYDFARIDAFFAAW